MSSTKDEKKPFRLGEKKIIQITNNVLIPKKVPTRYLKIYCIETNIPLLEKRLNDLQKYSKARYFFRTKKKKNKKSKQYYNYHLRKSPGKILLHNKENGCYDKLFLTPTNEYIKIILQIYDHDVKKTLNNEITRYAMEYLRYAIFTVRHFNHKIATWSIYEAYYNAIIKYAFFFKVPNVYKPVGEIFCGVMRKWNVLRGFFRKYWVIRRLSRVHNYDYDMTMDKLLSEYPEYQIIMLYENRIIYRFTTKDMIQIINTSLLYNHQFVMHPKQVKNPFTNLPFSVGSLYAIFFHFKRHFDKLRFPDLLYHFYLCDFNIETLYKCHEDYLREQAINHYVQNESLDNLYLGIRRMIYDHKHELDSWNIHRDYPKELVVRYLKSPYLFLYYQSQYAMYADERQKCKSLLSKKLRNFHAANPRFGSLLDSCDLFGQYGSRNIVDKYGFHFSMYLQGIIEENERQER